MKNKKVVITGATGYLGSVLKDYLLETRKYNLVLLTEDLTDSAYDACLSRTLLDASVVIHLAAKVASKTEDGQSVIDLNVGGTKRLLGLCGSNTHFVFLSSDYVFKSDSDRIYDTHDERQPETLYGKTKLEAEHYVVQSGLEHTILRTSMLYGYCVPWRTNFIQFLKNKLVDKEVVDVYSDVFSRPTHVLDLCKFIALVIEQKLYGIYHTCSDEYVSRVELAMQYCKKGLGHAGGTYYINIVEQPEGGRLPRYLNMKPDQKFLDIVEHSIYNGDFFNARIH